MDQRTKSQRDNERRHRRRRAKRDAEHAAELERALHATRTQQEEWWRNLTALAARCVDDYRMIQSCSAATIIRSYMLDHLAYKHKWSRFRRDLTRTFHFVGEKLPWLVTFERHMFLHVKRWYSMRKQRQALFSAAMIEFGS